MKNKILSYLGQTLLTLLFRLNRLEVSGEEHIRKAQAEGVPVLLVTWHGRVVYGAYWIYRAKLHPWTVASRHGDGEIMAQIVKRWGYKLIRGSSSKGSRAVLKKMKQVFTSPDNMVAITSDGPKGPARIAKPGSIKLARKYRARIIVIAGASTKYWQFNSWDNFRIPKPFGTVKILVGAPLEIPLDRDLEADEESRLVSDYLNNYQDECDRSCSGS
ncbi:MAG: lysophospholipid acyltransferase family protein [FCB group bacterium]|nr:lysophospholipid acyltransferase family protein [FCB group bacterium]